MNVDPLMSFELLVLAVFAFLFAVGGLSLVLAILIAPSGSLRDAAGRAVRWLQGHLTHIVSWLGLLIVVGFLLIELLGIFIPSLTASAPDPKRIGTLFLILVAAAALGQLGPDLLKKIKKVGPVEFFDKSSVQFLEKLASIDLDEYIGVRSEAGVRRKELSEKQAYEFRQADLYLSSLEFSGLDKELNLSQDERYHRLLLKVGTIASMRKEWAGAVARLEKLIELTGGRYRPLDTHHVCGMAYLGWALAEPEDRDRAHWLEMARQRLEKATESHKGFALPYFWLAFVQDEMGFLDTAIQSNREALRVRPLAGAKYNIAISLVKKGQLEAACQQLETLEVEDENVEEVKALGRTDKDLEPLRKDPHYKDRVAAVVGEPPPAPG